MSELILPDSCTISACDGLFGDPVFEVGPLSEAMATTVATADEHVRLCREVFGVSLDFSENSVELLDTLITEQWDKPPTELAFVVTEFGAYLAEVFHRNLGGHYAPRTNLLHMSIRFDEANLEVFPFHKVHKRFMHGDADSLAYFYRAVKPLLAQPRGS